MSSNQGESAAPNKDRIYVVRHLVADQCTGTGWVLALSPNSHVSHLHKVGILPDRASIWGLVQGQVTGVLKAAKSWKWSVSRLYLFEDDLPWRAACARFSMCVTERSADFIRQ